MAVIQRDMFPPNIMQRIQTPVRRNVIGSLQVSRERPWGMILYPEPQQSGSPQGRRNG